MLFRVWGGEFSGMKLAGLCAAVKEGRRVVDYRPVSPCRVLEPRLPGSQEQKQGQRKSPGARRQMAGGNACERYY